jgi:hypothetical protein
MADIRRWNGGGRQGAICEQGFSVDGLRLVRDRGLLRFGTVCGFRSWIITDVSGKLAQARRHDLQGYALKLLLASSSFIYLPARLCSGSSCPRGAPRAASRCVNFFMR